MSSNADFTSTPVPHEFDRNALLEQAAHELDVLSGHLGASGTPTATPEGNAVRSLKNDDVRFVGFPAMEKIQENSLLTYQHQEPITIEQLTEKYNFYWLPIPIMLKTDSNWVYNELQLHLFLSSEDAPPYTQPRAYYIFPEGKIDTTASGTLSGGISADIHAQAGANVDPQQVDIGIAQASLGAGANLSTQAKAAIEINKSFEKFKAKIIAKGINKSEVELIIEEARFLLGDLPIAVIVQIPKTVKTLKMDADTTAYRYFAFAPRRLKEVFPQLSQKVKAFFTDNAPITARIEPEPWNLTPLL